MKNPSDWKKADLYKHLQHAIDLELWTIPLYLTSLYSIKDLKKLRPENYPDDAKLILSVVVQEMLHLELVCNICNALGYAPKISQPVYDGSKGVPFIHPDKLLLPEILKDYKVKPGALNYESLKLFCVIELPHLKVEPDWDKLRSYDSIATLYTALEIGIQKFWNECYVGDERNTRQKENFNEYHNQEDKSHGFSQIVNSLDSALKAVEAIVAQGEGADSRNVPTDYRPIIPVETKRIDAGWFKANLSHYHKFRLLLHHHKTLPTVYEEFENPLNQSLESKSKKAFADLFMELEMFFNQDGKELPDIFWQKMSVVGKSMMEDWEKGICPKI